MPLRDHFHPPVDRIASWEEMHALWPGLMSVHLNEILPEGYRSGPRVHLDSVVEVDVATFERDFPAAAPVPSGNLSWQREVPTLLLDTEEFTPAEYEVRVFNNRAQQLVAVVELISPSNKDRPQSREVFVSKCHALLASGVCVILIDVVTNYTRNLFAELAERLEAPRPALADAALYAVTCLPLRHGQRMRIQTWPHELHLGAPLPTLPLFLNPEEAVPLELERTYEATCAGLRLN
jgi:hypothetical protein